MGQFMDLSGQRFGQLTCLNRTANHKKQTVWRCQCDCGNIVEVQLGHLRSGRIVSCGCYKRENSRQKAIKHGHRFEKLYYIWSGIRQRCLNPNNKSYKNYGGRGITITDAWADYSSFRQWALAHGYSEGLTIERLNVNGNYDPQNCTWIPRSEQNKNTRRTLNNRHSYC